MKEDLIIGLIAFVLIVYVVRIFLLIMEYSENEHTVTKKSILEFLLLMTPVYGFWIQLNSWWKNLPDSKEDINT